MRISKESRIYKYASQSIKVDNGCHLLTGIAVTSVMYFVIISVALLMFAALGSIVVEYRTGIVPDCSLSGFAVSLFESMKIVFCLAVLARVAYLLVGRPLRRWCRDIEIN